MFILSLSARRLFPFRSQIHSTAIEISRGCVIRGIHVELAPVCWGIIFPMWLHPSQGRLFMHQKDSLGPNAAFPPEFGKISRALPSQLSAVLPIFFSRRKVSLPATFGSRLFLPMLFPSQALSSRWCETFWKKLSRTVLALQRKSGIQDSRFQDQLEKQDNSRGH